MNSSQNVSILSIRRHRLIGWSGLLASALLVSTAANATIATGVLSVTATVSSTCIVGTSTLAFGSATSAAILAGNIDATGTVLVNCSSGTGYVISLDKGAGAGATIASRKMTAGANLLNYTIYTQTAHTTEWGDGTASSATVSGTGSGIVQSISAFGRIFSGQNTPAASYTDTVNVSVSY